MVLAADTVVVSAQGVLNKPVNAADAACMLRLLRGARHVVVTGYCVLSPGSSVPVAISATVSQVTMRTFTEAQLAAYVETGESLDKAGAYAVQGLGRSLVGKVEGCMANVIGLPICEVREALSENGADLLPYLEGGYCAYCSTWQELRTS